MTRNMLVVFYIVVLIAVVVGVDLLFFKAARPAKVSNS